MEKIKPKHTSVFSHIKMRDQAPITPRDLEILKYIWKWKVASTASIHESINRSGSTYSTTKVLEKLERNYLIESRFDRFEQFYVWQLTSVGFEEIKTRLGELIEDGYSSENHRHDRLVQALQLGDWATFQNPRVIHFTEQEMRRKDVPFYPEWVPKTKEHRADGYTRIVGTKKPSTIGYEVELSAKSIQRYEAIIRFYGAVRQVDRVIWVVEDNFVKDQILRAKANVRDETTNYHLFVDLQEFSKYGWDSKLTNECSNSLGTIRDFMQGLCGDLAGEFLGTLRGHSSLSAHLVPNKILGKNRKLYPR